MKSSRLKPKLFGIKCMKCPYYLGIIKCIISPCTECILLKRKKHPFTEMLSDNRRKEAE